MIHQVGHEGEWLRQLRQKEQGMRREIHCGSAAASLTTSITETQSARRTARFKVGTVGALVKRLARFAAASLRRPVGAAPRS